MQKRYLSVNDFDKTQMYKDRNSIWIKLHCSILIEYKFSALPDAAKFHALGLMIFAARTNNKFPDDEAWLRRQINANSEINLKLLLEIGFLEVVKGSRTNRKKSFNDGNSNKANDESVKPAENLRELEQNRTQQNRTEQKRTEHHTTQQSAKAKAVEDAPENGTAAVCVDFTSFRKKPENQTAEVFNKSSAAANGDGHLSAFTLEECLSYVHLCAFKGDDIKNPKGLATNLYQTGKSDAFIRAAMFPEQQQKADLKTYGEPVKFSDEACRVCYGAKMADIDGKGFGRCRHCRNERGIATGLEPLK